MTETIPSDSAIAPRRPLWRVLRVALAIPTTIIVVSIVTLVAAQVIRDRTIWLALLMYIPLWPVAIAAAAWDLLLLGRALPLRFLLLCLGLATGLLSIGMMWSPPAPPEGDASLPTIQILQWNTQWGGRQGQATLDRMVDEMKRRAPDIICLAEAPSLSWMESTWNRRVPGDRWHFAHIQNRQPQSYLYHMVVLSRFPVRLMQEWPLPFGRAALFEVDTHTRTLRIMLVDMESYELHPRTPGIREAARIVDEFARMGQPIDIVAGDFNSPARFIGFDDLAAAGEGYVRGALWSGQWRATWPTSIQYHGRQFRHTLQLSSLDIDHVFLRRNIDVVSAQIFSNDATDHRGQTVIIRLK